MLLGGLWHRPLGAWSCGAPHGAGLVAQRALARGVLLALVRRVPLLTVAATLMTVLAGWVLFCAPDLQTAQQVYRATLCPQAGIVWHFP